MAISYVPRLAALLLVLVFSQGGQSTLFCQDGSLPICRDGSLPTDYRDLHVRDVSGSSYGGPVCPRSCDPHRNTCDPTTAPTCTFADPRVPGARAACACRPGYKASGVADDDTRSHWRLPVLGQEHRVWVAEGVRCDARCTSGYGAQSCGEVVLLPSDCVGGGGGFSGGGGSGVDSNEYGEAYDPSYSRGGGAPPNASYSSSSAATGTSAAHYEETYQPEDQYSSYGFDDPMEMSVDTSHETDYGGGFSATYSSTEYDEDSIDAPMEMNSDIYETDYDGGFSATSSSTGSDEESTEAPAFTYQEHDPDEDGYASFSSYADQDQPHQPYQKTNNPAGAANTALPPSYSAAPPPPPPEKRDISKQKQQQQGHQVRRDIDWVKEAKERGLKTFQESWQAGATFWAQPLAKVDMSHEPCDPFTRTFVDSCKKGVRAQVASCKQAIRDSVSACKQGVKGSIDACKNDVGRQIDQCKRGTRNPAKKWKCEGSRPGMMAACEARRPGEMARCEATRIDLPFCEFDRLTAGCCEGFRSQAQALCAAGVGVNDITRKSQQLQAACSVATAIAKSAVKSYLTGQVVGLLADVQGFKQVQDAVKFVDKAKQARAQWDRWSEGLVAVAEGRLNEGQNALAEIASQISPDIKDAVAWGQAAEALINQNLDEFLTRSVAVAADMEQIMAESSDIQKLQGIAKSLTELEKAGRECADTIGHFYPDSFDGWKDVKDASSMEAAVEAYGQWYRSAMAEATRCIGLVQRVVRVAQA